MIAHEYLVDRLKVLSWKLDVLAAQVAKLRCLPMGTKEECDLAEWLKEVALSWQRLDTAADDHFENCEWFGEATP